LDSQKHTVEKNLENQFRQISLQIFILKLEQKVECHVYPTYTLPSAALKTVKLLKVKNNLAKIEFQVESALSPNPLIHVLFKNRLGSELLKVKV
jgi:hypothetical protein